jgi:hypothetical protein
MTKILPARPSYTYTEDDWTHLRAHFMGSILVDVHLHKLAQNIGASWPIKDKGETPARYLEYSFSELLAAPGLNGQPARLQLLLDILKETACFDNPFQDMVSTAPVPKRSVESAAQLLRRVGVPTDYPVEFTALSPDTRRLCEGEGATTICDAVALFQSMAQSVIVGGDVRQLLNSLANADLQTLASHLPLRPGTRRGLHLAEAIGILIRAQPDSAREACFTAARDPGCLDASADVAFQHLRERLPRLLELFPDETQILAEIVSSGESIERFFVTLANADLENAAVCLVRGHFAPPVQPEPAPVSLVGRLAKLFRRSP